METPKASDVRKGMSVLWETLQCPICLDLLTAPVSTQCDHQFCKFCIRKILDNSKQNRASCPVCKAKITKRSLQESPGFQRLVAGLQDMIQAYEHDTGTNYFTGMTLQGKTPGVTDAEATNHPHKMSSGDTPVTDADNVEIAERDDLSSSQSSTRAALNGFARLMGLEDSTPLTTENEGLDSGLGDAPPMSENKINASINNLEPVETDIVPAVVQATSKLKSRAKKRAGKLENTPLIHPLPIQDKTEYPPLRKSSRTKQKTDLEPDKIFEQKKKKSLEKVAEWLMKVPTEGSLELDKMDKGADDSDSCSSTSTIDVQQQIHDTRREDRAKALQAQVFGAVYKRGRRGKRTISRPLHVCDEAPTDRIQTVDGSEDKIQSDVEEEQPLAEEVNGTIGDFFKESEQETTADNIDCCGIEWNTLPESDENKSKDKAPAPVSDPEQLRPERNSKKTWQKALQQVDSDLQEQAGTKSERTEQKKPDGRKSKNTRSEKGKPAKVSNPLVLVGVQNGETSPKRRLRSEEVQVQIENYPSSEDQEVPLMRNARRSRRLQLFAEEVQAGHRTAVRKSKAKAEKVGGVAKMVESGTLDEAESPEKGNAAAKRNGCIYNQDLGDIENMESGENTSCREQRSEVPLAESDSEATAACYVPVVPGFGPTEEASVCHALESNKPANQFPTYNELETSKRAMPEKEEDKNDSEMDTEQLLQSFKSTKRKSFHLGEPNPKRSRDSDPGNPRGAEAGEKERVNSGGKSAKKQTNTKTPEIPNQEASGENEHSMCSDFISPSISPLRTKKSHTTRPERVMEEALVPVTRCSGQVSGSSPSSALSPNKVSKQEMDPPQLSVVPHLVDSGLRFTAVQDEELSEASSGSCVSNNRLDCSMSDGGMGSEIKGRHSDIPADDAAVAESSLTPDGLITPVVQMIQEANDNAASAEPSSYSPIQSNRRRKKRRTQRLESSSESDCSGSGEELPTLTQILGRAAPPAVATGDGEDSDGAGGCQAACVNADAGRPPVCPSPDFVDSSQASVDLFGTPDECDIPVNNNVESSQFSSEVLVTQQKIQMQNELVRLEKLMALVTEVLHEKEHSPAKETNPNGAETDGPLLRYQDTFRDSDQKVAVGDAEQEPVATGADNKGVTRHSGPKHEAVQRSTHTGLSAKGTEANKTAVLSSAAKTPRNCSSPSDGREDKENSTPPRDGSKARLVLVSSGLGASEQVMVKRFAKRVGARAVSQVTPEVTHIIMRTDEQLVCERTLKYFLGIAGRKWVVSFQWISECFKQKKLLDESPFEVKGDVVNGPNHKGPSRARTSDDNNLLMKNYKICFQGPFTDMTTDELEWMVELCGAAVVKDPRHLDSKPKSHQLVIVQPGRDSSLSTYSSLSRQATVVTRGWLLDTVATYTLRSYNNYTP